RASLAGAAAVASLAIALALAAGPSPGPGVGTIATARADSDDTAPASEVIGRSVRGKPIVATRYGDATSDRVALVVGVIHGDEQAGLRIVRNLRRIAPTVEGAQLWVIPTVNPDGVRAHTRKNAHGVDLNRNFPYRWRDNVPHSSGYYPGPHPSSEPETRAVMDFVRRIQPDLSIWYHQPWGAVLACRGRPPIAPHYAKLVGMKTSCMGNDLRGTAITWEMHAFAASTAFVVEMPAGTISSRSAGRQARAALTVAEGR
ncbi:MAG: murein peptide amidase, partial [Solirubrobacterales bacterium]|nr:murein peptide amidase [Solirubrobacterales bacterium]